jgi:hypothetical protein
MKGIKEKGVGRKDRRKKEMGMNKKTKHRKR